jgi:DNA polymerase delta subunit 4
LNKLVHQQGMSLHDKVLREFDLSSQFGPCIGIARHKRWMRAKRLGMEPPLEVLAVLLMEEKKGAKVQMAYVDELMGSKQQFVDEVR